MTKQIYHRPICSGLLYSLYWCVVCCVIYVARAINIKKLIKYIFFPLICSFNYCFIYSVSKYILSIVISKWVALTPRIAVHKICRNYFFITQAAIKFTVPTLDILFKRIDNVTNRKQRQLGNSDICTAYWNQKYKIVWLTACWRYAWCCYF